MPKIIARPLKPPAITRLQGETSFRMGAPPVPGKAVTTGNNVSVGAGGTGVSVGETGLPVGVAVDIGCARAGRSSYRIGIQCHRTSLRQGPTVQACACLQGNGRGCENITNERSACTECSRTKQASTTRYTGRHR